LRRAAGRTCAETKKTHASPLPRASPSRTVLARRKCHGRQEEDGDSPPGVAGHWSCLCRGLHTAAPRSKERKNVRSTERLCVVATPTTFSNHFSHTARRPPPLRPPPPPPPLNSATNPLRTPMTSSRMPKPSPGSARRARRAGRTDGRGGSQRVTAIALLVDTPPALPLLAVGRMPSRPSRAGSAGSKRENTYRTSSGRAREPGPCSMPRPRRAR
jgi:hypothetical protein